MSHDDLSNAVPLILLGGLLFILFSGSLAKSISKGIVAGRLEAVRDDERNRQIESKYRSVV